MNTYIFVGWHKPSLEAIPYGWWAEAFTTTFLDGSPTEYRWFLCHA